jgi:hypothetical protein
VVSAAGENVGQPVMSGKEALNVPRRLEPLHDPLSSSGRLMGVFGPLIEALVLTMLDPGHDLPLGSGVALQLVGDEHTRGSTLLLEELAEQAFGGLLVAPALDENIKNEAVLVDGTPEPMLLPGEADDNLARSPGGISPPGAPRRGLHLSPAVSFSGSTSQVRSGLFAGGRWIRTFGSATDPFRSRDSRSVSHHG